MKLFFTTILFLFPIFFDIVSSDETERGADTLCKMKFNPHIEGEGIGEEEILSIFSLVPELIIQTKNRKTGNSSFWTVYQTDDNHMEVFLNEYLWHDFNILEFESEKINPNWPIMALQMDSQNSPLFPKEMYEYCKGEKQKLLSECIILSYTLKDDEFTFVCVFNPFTHITNQTNITDEVLGMPALYESFKYRNSGRLKSIRRVWPHIEKYFSKLCKVRARAHSIFFSELKDSARTWILAEMTLIHSSLPYTKIYISYDFINAEHNQLDIHWTSIIYPTSDFYHLFRFNSSYKMMGCTHMCTLDTPLKELSLLYGDKRLDIKRTDLTLRRMIGCKTSSDDTQPTPEVETLCKVKCDPDIIHDKKGDHQMISIFNLFEDLYLQIKNIETQTISFWRVYGTDVELDEKPIEGIEAVPQSIRNRVVANNELYHDLKKLNLDPQKPVTSGPLFPEAINKLILSKLNCETQPQDIDKKKACNAYIDIHLSTYLEFVCVYNGFIFDSNEVEGQEVGTYVLGVPALYNTLPKNKIDTSGNQTNRRRIEGGRIDSIGPELTKIIETQKKENVCGLRLQTFSILYNSTRNQEFTMSLNVYTTLWNNPPIALFFTFKDNKFIKSYRMDPTKDLFNLFRFNGHYNLMGCAARCTLDSQLKRLVFKNVGNKEQDFHQRPMNFALRDLLGCNQTDLTTEPSTTPSPEQIPSKPSKKEPLNEEDICKLWNNRGLYPTNKEMQILSIFNLYQDLIIQIRNRSTAQSYFWRVYNTDMKPENDDYYDRNDNKSIPKGIRENVYYSEDLWNDLNELVFLDLDYHFYPWKPVMAHPMSSNLTDPMLQDCNKKAVDANDTTVEPETKETQTCKKFKDIYYSQHLRFVCVYNGFVYDTDLPSQFSIVGVPAVYNTLPRNKIDPKGNKTNEKRIKGGRLDNVDPELQNYFKRNKCQIVGQNVYSIWYEDPKRDQYNLTSSIYQNMYESDPEVVLRTYDPESGQVFKNHTIKGKTQFYHMFRFNDYYNLMVAPILSTLDIPLKILSFRDLHAQNESVQITETNLTLRRMLGCKQEIRFDPNYFCHPKRKFLSIFNLGNDVYFQESGRFWRYNYHGFNINKPFMRSVTLDSDMTAFLENYKLDTYQQITGFTFNEYDFDLCSVSGRFNSLCNTRLSNSKEYFNACIFGKNTETGWTIVKSLVYTPSGLSRYRNTSLQINYFHRCDDIRIAVTGDDHDHTHALMQVTSINAKEVRVGNKIFLQIYAIFVKNSVEYHLSSIQFEIYPEMKLSLVDKQEIPEHKPGRVYAHHSLSNADHLSDPIYLRISLFYFNDKQYFYYNRSLFDLIPIIKSYTIWSIRIITRFNNSETFEDILKCPFNSSTTLVTVRRERVCDQKNTTSIESVFMIGRHSYHQIGKHFYKYIEFSKRFVYDKYVSNLLNEYFDTTYRVTGFSVPHEYSGSKIHSTPYHYDVLIHGKSNQMYRHFGEYIYATFIQGDNLHNKTISPLSAIDEQNSNNDKLISTFKPYPFGGSVFPINPNFVDAFAVLHKLTSPIKHPLIFISTDQFAKDKEVLKFISQPTNAKDVYTFMYNKELKDDAYTYFYIVNEIGKLSQLEFDQIVGIHEPLNNFQSRIVGNKRVLVSVKKRGQPIKVYAIVSELNSFYHNITNIEGQDGELLYYQLFCISNAISSSDLEEKPKTLLSILAFLILVLLLVVLFVAFYSYRRNQRLIEQKHKNEVNVENSEKKTTNTSPMNSSESDSNGLNSNQIEAKSTLEENSSKNLETDSKASDSLSIRSE